MSTRIYTLESLVEQTNGPLSTLDTSTINDAIQDRLAFINAAVSEQMRLIAQETEKPRKLWGTIETSEMKEVGEFGEARSVANQGGIEIGFPLRKYSRKTGWSEEWYMRATPAELERKVTAAQVDYFKKLQDEIKFAIFSDENYDFVDWLKDGSTVHVKAFLNADSAVIPDAPNGTSFNGATHNHYKGTSGASLAATDVDALITNVVEHGNMLGVALFTTNALVETLAGLASTKFVRLSYQNITPANASASTTVKDNADNDPDNKLCGYWGNYPVYTRSWVPAGYIACLATGASEKPLAFRVEDVAGLRGLLAMDMVGNNTITAQEWRAYFGFAVNNRAAGAVLDTAHQTNYTEPTLAR